jgi:hypothetical protein
MTIQQALRILKDEGLSVSRQGSGVYARARTERPVGLRPPIEGAFEADTVRIDVAGYTAETLHGIIAEALDKVRAGRLSPKAIRVRLLLPDLEWPLALPVLANGDPESSDAVRDRMAGISARHVGAIEEGVYELLDLGLVSEASVETRVHGSAPLFKCYIVNETDVFFGYYPVMRHEVRIEQKKQAIFDPMGKDAVMFHHTEDGDPDSTATQFVGQTRSWFDSVWTTIARPAR